MAITIGSTRLSLDPASSATRRWYGGEEGSCGLAGQPQLGQWPAPSRCFSLMATTAWVFQE